MHLQTTLKLLKILRRLQIKIIKSNNYFLSCMNGMLLGTLLLRFQMGLSYRRPLLDAYETLVQ
jgi:hypothetical protein